MQENPRQHDPTPADCFQQAELELFQSFESQTLETITYYLWHLNAGYGMRNAESAFLYALEMQFETGETLLLSSGESSEAIRAIAPESLLETARKLHELHDEALIQRMAANAQPLWQGAVGAALGGIQLSRHESGLYRNDALLLDFGEKKILLQLSQKEGLELAEH
ncbi:MAG: hypothetical protein ACKVUS_02585 [Saprospiraceae bacterium]